MVRSINTKIRFWVFSNWVYRRIFSKNQNLIAIYVGGTGSGKSWACLTTATKLSRMFGTHFTVEDNLAFTFPDLLRKMQLPQNQAKGTCFIMEEVGAFGSGASAREWQSQANKFFFSFLQTSRHRNQVLLLNCPSFSYLEKGSRMLVHMRLESLGVNKEQKRSWFKPMTLIPDRSTGKGTIYNKYLRFRDFGDVGRKLKKIDFEPPQHMIAKCYEKYKLEFTTKLNASILDETGGRLTKRQQEIFDLLKTGLNQSRVAEKLGVSSRCISGQVRLMKKKGVIINGLRNKKTGIIEQYTVESPVFA